MDEDQVEIRFSPEDVATFRAWQAEQRAKLAAREAETREPWEVDPDAWKDR